MHITRTKLISSIWSMYNSGWLIGRTICLPMQCNAFTNCFARYERNKIYDNDNFRSKCCHGCSYMHYMRSMCLCVCVCNCMRDISVECRHRLICIRVRDSIVEIALVAHFIAKCGFKPSDHHTQCT